METFPFFAKIAYVHLFTNSKCASIALIFTLHSIFILFFLSPFLSFSSLSFFFSLSLLFVVLSPLCFRIRSYNNISEYLYLSFVLLASIRERDCHIFVSIFASFAITSFFTALLMMMMPYVSHSVAHSMQYVQNGFQKKTGRENGECLPFQLIYRIEER